MRDFLYRLERLLFGSPLDLSDAYREQIRALRALMNENSDQAERVPYPLPSHPNAKALRYPEHVRIGIERELAFRRYAQRSGERAA